MRVRSVDRRTLTGTAVVVMEHRCLWWRWTQTWASHQKGTWLCVETGAESRTGMVYGGEAARACEAALVVDRTDAMVSLEREMLPRGN